MTAGTVRVALRWSDIAAMPPGRRRDQLAYSWRRKAREQHLAAVFDAEAFDAIRTQAEHERRLAIATYRDPADLLRERRAVLALVTQTGRDT